MRACWVHSLGSLGGGSSMRHPWHVQHEHVLHECMQRFDHIDPIARLMHISQLLVHCHWARVCSPAWQLVEAML